MKLITLILLLAMSFTEMPFAADITTPGAIRIQRVSEDGTYLEQYYAEPTDGPFITLWDDATGLQALHLESGINFTPGHWQDDIPNGTWIPGQFKVGVTPEIDNALTTMWDDMVERTDNEIENITLTPGPAGPTGATGAKGDKGDKGDTGSTGAAGTNGTNGTNGATGATGATGADGILSVQRTKITTGSNGAGTWTFATPFPVGTVPVISSLPVNNVSGESIDVKITSVTRTAVSFQISKISTVLGLLTLNFATPGATEVHLTAVPQ